MSRPEIQGFYDDATNTISYLVSDPKSKAAVIVDPVLDFDPKSGRTSTHSADEILAGVEAGGLDVSGPASRSRTSSRHTSTPIT